MNIKNDDTLSLVMFEIGLFGWLDL
jgi:hypothetical protein